MTDWLKQILSSRTLSLLVATVYLLIVLIAGVLKPSPSIKEVLGMLLITAGGILLPLACIWFGDELGDYLGAFPGPAITKRSPGWLVQAAGWFLLLLPPVAALVMYASFKIK